jgi:hypothetical protein
MRGLCTARVVVIDDMPDEAMPIIQALGRLSVGCVHIKGDELEALPTVPLSGVRLVFLDMKLGTAGNARTTGAHTANVFSRVIAAGTAPILVVLWTRHPEFIEEFQKALFQANPSFRHGVFFTSMDKSTLLAADEQEASDPAGGELVREIVPSVGLSSARIEVLRQQIEDQLKACPPLQVAWTCEQLAHDAATSTTTAISVIVSGRSKIADADDDSGRKQKWLAALCHIYRSLILASAGKNRSDETAFDDLVGAIAEIYRDRLDMHAAVDPVDMSDVLRVAWSGPDENECAELNTMFLTARVSEGEVTVRPGNVYIATTDAGMDCPHTACYVDPQALMREIIKVRGYGAFGDLEKKIAAYKNRSPVPEELLAKDSAELETLWAEIKAKCIPILLELTPSCDFAQRTRQCARFAGGLLVSAELIKKLSDSDSVKDIGPIKVPAMDGIWHPVVSSRFPFSVPAQTVRTAPLFRIRQGALLDVQVWFASQAARPGYLKAERQ